MPELNLTNTTTSNMRTTVQSFTVATRTPDSINSGTGDTNWDYPDFTQFFGYYKSIPELKKAIDALARYTIGKGFTANPINTVDLDHISGWGEDTFESIMWNMIVMKKVCGDAFAEIIRDGGTRDGVLLNIKVLDTGSMRTVVAPNGRIKHYVQRSKTENGQERKLEKWQVLHLVNDRVADEIHGVSVVEACKWIIDARNEAMSDWRRISHRSTIRVLYIDAANTTRINEVKTQYATAIKNGEVMLIPAKKGEAEFADLVLPPVEAFLAWIRYLENAFYQAVGVPKVVLGGSEEFTEASSKIALVTFDQDWQWEQRQLEADLWNQLGMRVTWYEPVSLKNELITDEKKNTGQTGFQPNDVTIGRGKA